MLHRKNFQISVSLEIGLGQTAKRCDATGSRTTATVVSCDFDCWQSLFRVLQYTVKKCSQLSSTTVASFTREHNYTRKHICRSCY